MSGERSDGTGPGGDGTRTLDGDVPGERPSATVESAEGLDGVHADEVGAPIRDASVAGVLLAAGGSSRFGGRNKLLVELDGEPLVRHAARTLLEPEAEVDHLVVVLGHEADSVRQALAGLDVEVVVNPDYREGQATSVETGLATVGDPDAVLFALGDMPFVLPRSVAGLVAAYRADVGEALAASYAGERGNPVLFGETYFDALADVEGDTGGRDILLTSDDAALVETGDPGVLADVDTPADLERYR